MTSGSVEISSPFIKALLNNADTNVLFSLKDLILCFSFLKKVNNIKFQIFQILKDTKY